MKSSSALDKSAKADRQAAKADSGFAVRLREAAAIKGFSQKNLAEISGVPAARVNDYWHGPKEANPKYLFALADALDVSAEWLALGRGPRGGRLIEVTDADWVEIEEFDLRQINDAGKGDATGRTVFRKDWLYSTLGETGGLWITRTLAPEPSRALAAGVPIFCKDQAIGELPIEGQHYLFRVNGGIVLARFSYRGQLGEDTVTPDDLDVGDNQHFIVARVLGALARPL